MTTTADTPKSLTELVHVIAKQDTATKDQAAELNAYLAGWVYSKGDALDHTMFNTTEQVDRCQCGVESQRLEVEFFDTATPSQLEGCYPREEADRQLAICIDSEGKALRAVSIGCAALVDAGEHGSDNRISTVLRIDGSNGAYGAPYSYWIV